MSFTYTKHGKIEVLDKAGTFISRHNQEREALESAANEALLTGEATVDYRKVTVSVKATVTDSEPVPEPIPDPEPEPDPDPIPPPPTDPPPAGSAGPNDYLDAIRDGEKNIVLQDGDYLQGMTVPSGVIITAANRGQAKFPSSNDQWSAIVVMNGSNAVIDGLDIGGNPAYGSFALSVGGESGSGNTVRNCGVHDGDPGYKHSIPLMIGGSGHLIEDCWAYGKGRYVIQSYGANNCTIRRCIARWDHTNPNEAYEPNAAFSIYSSHHMTIENNISLDYNKPQSRMDFGGDFYGPQHPESGQNNNNKWLGNMAVNHHPDTDNANGIRLDPDSTETGSVIDDMFIRNVTNGYVLSSSASGTEIGRGTLIGVSYRGAEPTGPADIDNRWIDGVKTSQPVWPFVNEDLAKAAFASERASAWTQFSGTLEEYIKG